MLYKKSSIHFFIIAVSLLLSKAVCAHNPDLSSVIISKTNSGQIILQINSSLTAFQQEVNYIHGEGFYKSPEDFQNLVIKQFNTSFSIILNKKDTLKFKNPKVFLGHETKLVAEIIGIPKTVNYIYLKNEVFKDIHNNQTVVIFLLDEFPKEKYTLNYDNEHEINIKLEDGKWKKVTKEKAEFNFKYLVYLLVLLPIGLFFYLISMPKTYNV